MVMGAPLANALLTSGPGVTHEREDLAPIIARIDPDETPFYSNISKGRAKAREHGFTVQELKALDTTAQPEGFQTTIDQLKIPDRFVNYTEITARSGSVSETYDAVDTLGDQRESARQRVLVGLEVRRDLERKCTNNVAGVGGNTRVSAGMPAWITNVDTGATGSAPTGDGTDTVTVGTDRAFDSIDPIDTVNEQSFQKGGRVRAMYMSEGLKRKFSKLPDAMGGATENRITQTEREPLVFVGAADRYLSDFGGMDVIVSLFMFRKTILGIDPRWVKYCHLPNRNMVAKTLGTSGDSTEFHVVNEGTVVPTAPKAHWAVYALDPDL